MSKHSIANALQQALFETILNQTSDIFIFSDTEGFIRVWNQAAEKILGYSHEEIYGKSLDLIIPEKLREAHWRGFHEAMQSKTLKHAGKVLTTRAIHKNGEIIYLDLSFFISYDEAGEVIGASALGRDVTQKFLQEKELKKTLTELKSKTN